MIKIGGTEITDVNIGSTPVQQVYMGSTLVWEREQETPIFINAVRLVSTIKTDLTINSSNIEVYMDSYITGTWSTHFYIGGSSWRTTRCPLIAVNDRQNTRIAFHYNNSYTASSSGVNLNLTSRHMLHVTSDWKLYVRDVLRVNFSSKKGAIEGDKHFYITGSSGGPHIIYSTKIYEEGILVGDFVPARTSAGIGLYDNVSNKMYVSNNATEIT